MKALAIAGVTVMLCAACVRSDLVLTGHAEATRRTAVIHTEFTKASGASNRAVMDTNDAAIVAAAADARTARQKVTSDIDGLRSLLGEMGYRDAARLLDDFTSQFAAYEPLDDELLAMVGENSNRKAQQLSFGPAREAVNELQSVLDSDTIAAAQIKMAALEILAMQAPHIAEPNDAPMTRMEADMAASEQRAREALGRLGGPDRAKAAAAFDRFMAINRQIVVLSRRNSNVRSLALALGEKWEATKQCEGALQALEAELAKRQPVTSR